MQLDMVQNSFDTNAKCTSCGKNNDIMDGLKQYICMYCGADNCLECNQSHPSNISCQQLRFGSNHPFRKSWTHNHNINGSDGAVLKDVTKKSAEWNSIVQHLKYPQQKVLHISRIEHILLWKK